MDTFPGISNYYEFLINEEKLSRLSQKEKEIEYHKHVTSVIVKLNTVADYMSLDKPFHPRYSDVIYNKNN